MATTVFLLRHAAHGLVDHVLCGRMAGVRLGPEGHAQARLLAERMAREARIAALHTSPAERCRETAAHLAQRLGLTAEVREALDEIDFGAWTGRSFAELQGDALWHDWNTQRDASRAPGGESMREAQARALSHIAELCRRHPDQGVALVSHGDVIKSVIAQVLGLPLQAYARFEIAPASVSAVLAWEGGGKLIGLNEVPVGRMMGSGGVDGQAALG
jgi:broad specificity phosphatase PhoE